MKISANHKEMKCTPTSIFLQASDKEVEAWMQYKSILLNNPQKQPRSYIVTSFGFSCMMKNFVSKTINDSNVDLEKFPVSKVRQLVKKMESSKATAYHIKQVVGDPQTEQINLMRHQCIEISTGKYKGKKSFVKPKQSSHKNVAHENSQESSYSMKSFDPRNVHKNKIRCSKCEDSTHVQGFQCPAKKFQCKKFGNFTSLCY